MELQRRSRKENHEHTEDRQDGHRRKSAGREEIQEEGEGTWIKRNIKRRECNVFIEDKAASPKHRGKKCKCGSLYEHHPKQIQEGKPEDEWKYEEHTVATKPTDAFGEIEFVGYGDQPAKYVRVDSETDMDKIVTLMMDKWHMKKPKLLVSVTGGAKDFRLKNRLKEACRRGLRSAAQIPGAWLVTGGTHAGVMKHVGKAVRDLGLTDEGSALTAIGIAPWGCVRKRDQLTDPNGKWPARYEVQAEDRSDESYLDPNHTHFILVDNGTTHKFATEIKLRTELESRIAQMQAMDTADDRVKVPVALLVLEGGPGTLKTVVHAIRKGTPAIVIKGSGRCADVLAYASQHSTPTEVQCEENGTTYTQIENTIDSREEDALTKLVSECMSSRYDDVTQLVELVKECVRYPHLLSVYELDARSKSPSDVDVAILKALLKAMKNNVMVQLELALSWNRVDVAKSEIFTDERTWKTSQLTDVMMVAIKQDKTSFVDLFLENGFILRDFVTIDRLKQLYQEIPPNCLLHRLLEKHKSHQSDEYPLKHVGRVIQNLMGSFYEPHHLKMTQILDDPAGPAQELFLWSVLMNQQEMAKLFWREGNESTAAALVANSLLKAMALKTSDTDTLNTLQKNALEFEELAIGVMNTCYYKHEQRALDVLVRELPRWGNTSCVLIALKSDNRRFISQTACQSLLTSVWMGKMSKDNGLLKLILCIFVFPLIFFIVNFRDDIRLLSKTSDKAPNRSPSQRSFTFTATRQSSRREEDTSSSSCGKLFLCWQKLRRFYRAPVIVFISNCISYLVFLTLYSYVLLVQLSPTYYFATETILIVWVVSIFLEGLRQFLLYSFKRSVWKFYLDGSTIIIFVLGACLRAVPRATCHMCFDWGRVFLALNVVPLFFRILYVFSISQELGPKVVMIQRMMKDLFWFVMILLVFITSYAIASEAILYPNTELSWQLLYRLPRKAYWTIYGELFLEEIEGDSCKEDDHDLPCPTPIGQYLVPVFMGVYILMTNVLLLNLLIAMFSYTFQKIHENTDIYWHFQKFGLIFEYSARPCLPPPFIVLGHLYIFFRWVGAKLGWWRKKSRTSYFKRPFEGSPKPLTKWEDIMTEKYLSKLEATGAKSVEGRVKVVMKRLETVQNRVDDLVEMQSSPRDLAQPQQGTVTVVAAPPTSDLLKQVIKQQQRLEDRLVGMEDRILTRIMKIVEQRDDTRHLRTEPTEQDTSL